MWRGRELQVARTSWPRSHSSWPAAPPHTAPSPSPLTPSRSHSIPPSLSPYYQLIILSHSSKLEKVECVSASPAQRPRAERRLNGRNSPRSGRRMKPNIVSGTKAAL